MTEKKYFKGKRSAASLLIQGFLILLFVFAVIFFLRSLMNYNKVMEEAKQREQKIERLTDEIEQLEYLIDAPLDEDFKIRIAREKLGMCFPDEMIFYADK
ncbi:MAG: septum formation initiator family protein [Ruminococcaceae bacterium]|nr:septum formation initiator family protein [Oscillospiraceae bacterium]